MDKCFLLGVEDIFAVVDSTSRTGLEERTYLNCKRACCAIYKRLKH